MAQVSFSTLWSGFETNEAAKAARDEFYRKLKVDGFTAMRSVLRGQIKQYASLGIPDGRMCDVYMIDTSAPWEQVHGKDKEMATAQLGLV